MHFSDVNNLKRHRLSFLYQVFVSEWEEFEAEREEISLWLADLDAHLTEVDHLTGSTCEKLRCLQVCACCAQLNSSFLMHSM